MGTQLKLNSEPSHFPGCGFTPGSKSMLTLNQLRTVSPVTPVQTQMLAGLKIRSTDSCDCNDSMFLQIASQCCTSFTQSHLGSTCVRSIMDAVQIHRRLPFFFKCWESNSSKHAIGHFQNCWPQLLGLLATGFSVVPHLPWGGNERDSSSN